MILAFFGEGKGKTTSAIGTLLRSLNMDKKVVLVQLYKNLKNIKSNELEFMQNLKLANFTLLQFGKKTGWVAFSKPSAEDLKLTKQATQKIISVIEQKKADLLVIDEILLAHFYGLCSDATFKKIISKCNENKIDLILTGRKMKKSLLPYLDLVTEMKKVKHPYDEKIMAREGIDY